MTVGAHPTELRSRSFRHGLALAGALLAWLAAGYLWQLQAERGPHQQRVNVRFDEDVSVEARQGFERQHGLAAGEPRDRRTWIYRLTDQSPGNIGALLRSPLVEDTAHIDPTRLRVVLDQPGLDPMVRELLERQWLPYGSWGLTLIGFVCVWYARSRVAHWTRVGVAEAPRVATAIAERVETLTLRQEVVIGLALCALFLTPLLRDGPSDDEEAGLGLFSSQIYYRDLLHGRWSYWLDDLGFGTPMPIGQRLDFHPVFALGSFISLRAALSAVWMVHAAVMAVYFRRLLAAGGLTPALRVAFFALYLFSFPSIQLFYTTDWVSCLVAWTLYPVLVYYVRDAVTGGAATRWWLTTVRLGVLFSVWVLNAHPGYLVPLFVALAAYALVVAPRTLSVYASLGTAGICAVAASAERIYFLVHEKGLFPDTIIRLTQGEYQLLAYLVGLAPPLTQMSDGRQPFIGTFVFAAAVAAAFMWRTFDRHIRACIVAFFVSLVMSMTPVVYVAWTGLSGGWLFRDPMVFFGLLTAAAVVPVALDAPGRLRQIALALVALQVGQQVIVVSRELKDPWRGVTQLEWYKHQRQPYGVGAAMVRAANRYGKRVYFSPAATDLSRGYLSRAGVHAVTDYALLGLNPVNVWFKNVSMDRIHPSWVLMHGMIRGQRSVIENATLLDVLGIDVVVATTEEGFAPRGLIRLEQLRATPEAGLDIFANPDAWPDAVLLSPSARTAALPIVGGCEHTAALCRDYTALAGMRIPGDVVFRDVGDGYRVHVPSSQSPRLLFVSAFYRAEWEATAADRNLTVEPIANAFIGVTVPPGIQDIELMFRPRTRIALTWVSGVSLVALLLALGALTWRRRAAPTLR